MSDLPPLITTREALDEAIAVLARMPTLAVDCETSGLDPLTHDLLLLQLGDAETQVAIDCRRVDLAPLKPLLEGETPKVLHHAKFDYKFLLARAGIRLANVVDTMLIEMLLAGGLPRPSFSLREVAAARLGVDLPKEERTTFEGHAGEFTGAQIDYARRDVAVTYRVLLAQMPRLADQDLTRVAKLECLAVPAFGDMELAGIHLDQDRWRAVVRDAQTRRDASRRALDEAFGGLADRDLFGVVLINYDSEEQVRAAFARAGIDLPDTAEGTLREIPHPAARALAAYREHQKVVSTYGENFLAHVHVRTGRIHPSFQQIGADSGRVSCRDPNLQSVKAGSEFRECFSAPPGKKIVTADYAGCELRIIAEASQDPVFLSTFREGKDLHAIVATAIFGKPVDKATHPELRHVAKTINFGLAYGMGTQGLAAQLGTTPEQAEQWMARYFATYSRIRDYLDASSRQAITRGHAETFLGRKRYFAPPDDPDSPEGRRQMGRIRRQAKNHPIQGTNADMIKLALVRLRDRVRERGLDARTVNMVHDEVVVECDSAQARAVAEVVREAMIDAGRPFIRSVPVEVDVTIADHWSK
jgi:DNA polymerase I-like protein with 3'-5' exonuclease and polymerase domains